jgi:SAM-dependent methyltransferase
MAESFGTDAERYDRARPSYPAEMVAAIVAASPGPDLLDVGCGTGIASRQFQAAGCRVLGVDPDDRMADLARRGGLDVEIGTFETWDAAGRTFDAVTAGQAWHWVDPAAGTAKAAEVLRPGGRLAVFWNAYQPAEDLRKAIGEVYRRALPDSPFPTMPASAADAYLQLFAKTADIARKRGTFGEPEEWRFPWDRVYTRDEWLDQLPTFGVHTRLPKDIMQQILDGIGAVIDIAGGRLTVNFTTVVGTLTRTA